MKREKEKPVEKYIKNCEKGLKNESFWIYTFCGVSLDSPSTAYAVGGGKIISKEGEG